MDKLRHRDLRVTPAFRQLRISKLSDQFIAKSVSGLLIAAAFMKSYHLSTSPTVDGYLFGSWLLTLCLVHYEVWLAALLFSGVQAKRLRFVLFITFSVFTVANLLDILRGSDSCGCFGSLRIPPAASLAINLFVLALLTVWRPTERELGKGRIAVTAALVVALTAGILIPISLFQVRGLDAGGKIVGSRGTVVLEPAKWVGQPFPLTRYIEGRSLLRTGEWRVILYEENCSSCKRLVQRLTSNPPTESTMMVHIGTSKTNTRITRGSLYWTRLIDELIWFAEVPLEIVVSDGIVTGWRSLR